MSAPRLPSPPRSIPIDLRDRQRFPHMAGIVLAVPGIIVECGATGIRVRVNPDGSLTEIGEGSCAGRCRP